VRKALLGVLCTLSCLFAVFEDMETGTRAEGMAGAFTAVADDACAIHFNPAGLAQVEKFNGCVLYKLLYSGVGENLHNATLNAALPLGRLGTVGASLQDMGFALDQERALTLSHGFRLAKDLHLGYGLAGYMVSMQDMGSGFALGLDLALHARLYKRWAVGFMAHNLNMPRIGASEKNFLPRLLNFGISFTPATGIVSSVDVSKEVGKPTRLAVGQEFSIVEDLLVLRAGVRTEPVRFGFGLGTGTRNIHVDYAVATHPELALTHNLGLSVSF
jgi:hypothetical protein